MANTPKPATVDDPELDGDITPEWGDAVNQAIGALLDFCHGIVANNAAKAALAPTEGFTVYQLDTNTIYTYNGAAWEVTAHIGAYTICTAGTRPASGLAEGKNIFETDTDRMLVYDGANWTLPKSSAGPYVCTAATRPTLGLFEGIHIYETDTDRRYVYSGAAWVYQGGGNDPTFASAYRNAVFNLTSGSCVRIPFDQEHADYGSNHAAGVYTCPVAGTYSVKGRYGTDAGAANERFICSIIKNGTTEALRGDDISIGGVASVGVSVAGEIPCAAGDTLGIGAFQVTGTSRAIAIGTAYAWGNFRRVSQ